MMARGFKTGGRKKGSLNKITSLMKESVAATGETPLAYMLRMMRDPDQPPERRDEMAKAAAPYLHPKLSSVDMLVDAEVTKKGRLGREPLTTEEWERQFGGGKSIQ
jgi:hypothetical protein